MPDIITERQMVEDDDAVETTEVETERTEKTVEKTETPVTDDEEDDGA